MGTFSLFCIKSHKVRFKLILIIVGLNLNSLDHIVVRFKPKLRDEFFFLLFFNWSPIISFRFSIKTSRDEWTLLYITSPYFQTKIIQILLKHIAYVTIINFINNLMNIALEDWLKNINPMLHLYNFTTNTIYIITLFSTCWDNKLWIVEDHFYVNLPLIL